MNIQLYISLPTRVPSTQTHGFQQNSHKKEIQQVDLKPTYQYKEEIKLPCLSFLIFPRSLLVPTQTPSLHAYLFQISKRSCCDLGVSLVKESLIPEEKKWSSQVDIASLVSDPSSPCLVVCILKVVNPSFGVEQRTCPSTVVQQLTKLAKSTAAFSNARGVDLVGERAGEVDSEFLVLLIIYGNEFCGGFSTFFASWQCSFQNRGCHARAHLVLISRQCQERGAGPQNIGSCCVSIALRGIKKEIANSCSRDVLVFWSNICKPNP